MNRAKRVYISSITEIEIFSTFRRLLVEKAIDENDFKILKNEFEIDFQFFNVIGFDKFVSEIAKTIIESYRLKSLDSIQLSTAMLLKDDIDYFVVCDKKLMTAGKKEGLKIKNPNK